MLDFGRTQEIDLGGGAVFTLSRLELRHLRRFKEWVEAREGDPFATVERFVGRVSDEYLMPMLREAEKVRDDLRAFSLDNATAKRHLGTEEGLARLCSCLMADAHPRHTEEESWAVARHVVTRLSEVLKAAQGAVPNAEAPAPQEEGAGAAAGGSTGGNSTGG